jgi:hypothetical protein
MTQHDVMTDKDYDLVSTLYHALQGVETSGRYLQDAEAAGDNEAGEFLKEAQGQYRQIADKAKTLLGRRIG